MVMVDRFTQSAHFSTFKYTYMAEDYTWILIDEIVCCHDIMLSIILDRGTQLPFRIWRSFQKGLGTKVKLSTGFHPQIDGQSKHSIQILEDML